jgi:CheY-like chemotaxis protein
MTDVDDSLFSDLPLTTSAIANKHDSPYSNNSSSMPVIMSEEIQFSGQRLDCCICFIDMMSSTKIASNLSGGQLGRYYSIFLNSIATIAKNFCAQIIKNAGDCLIFYFPATANPIYRNSFKEALEGGITMIAAHRFINLQLHEEKLPPLDYRISMDYGEVELAKSSSSRHDDLFGSSVNVCAKINSKAQPNGMVIGKKLYEVVKSFNEYVFEEVGKLALFSSVENEYPVYSVSSSQKQIILNPFARKVSEPITYYNDSSEQQNQPRSGRKVLLVDDDEDVLFTYKTFLESEGYIVDAHADSLEALAKFEKSTDQYDIVVTDIKMPNLNGLELYKKVKSLNETVDVLFVSAVEAADMLVSVLPGLTEKNIVKKPVIKESLLRAVKFL